MGKAKTQLNKARKECFSQLSTEIPKHVLEREAAESAYYVAEMRQIHYEEKVSNVISQVREELLHYAEANGYPLCEYLTYSNVEQFLQWLMDKQRL